MFFKLSSLTEVVDSLKNMVYLVYLVFFGLFGLFGFLVYSVFWFICCRNPEGIIEESYRNPVRILKGQRVRHTNTRVAYARKFRQ